MAFECYRYGLVLSLSLLQFWRVCLYYLLPPTPGFAFSACDRAKHKTDCFTLFSRVHQINDHREEFEFNSHVVDHGSNFVDTHCDYSKRNENGDQNQKIRCISTETVVLAYVGRCLHLAIVSLLNPFFFSSKTSFSPIYCIKTFASMTQTPQGLPT